METKLRHSTLPRRRVAVLCAAAVMLAVAAPMTPAAVSADRDAQANDGPQLVVKRTTQKLWQALAKRKVEPAEARRLVADIVMPHVDFDLASRWVLGKHWAEASAVQRERFKREFRTLLVRTYTSAILESSGESVEYLPAKVNADGTEAVVRTRVAASEGPSIDVQYRLRREKDAWRVFDIIVAGSSLVATYRMTFAEQADRAGLDGLIEELRKKNRALQNQS
jgi:phospholipid transport system substrate-binding protein